MNPNLLSALEASMIVADPDQEMNYGELARACLPVVDAEVERFSTAIDELREAIGIDASEPVAVTAAVLKYIASLERQAWGAPRGTAAPWDKRSDVNDLGSPLGWWAIAGNALIDALRRVAAGANPDLVYAELYANSTVETPRDGER